jgi:hypothetical protein
MVETSTIGAKSFTKSKLRVGVTAALIGCEMVAISSV